ncbi:hypothetical protein A4X06_0g5848 [Tilletia controversa]|uniref:Uncharacterized protein n=1 Tax=Tilletia controversa TaxID=13291 RepID=A0A8X7MQL1_9BASI|nr:hypothetical protein CF328_g6020 [Tilletia controversa]KAE8245042.1 hypothetical protein A4X06_0g5848 [Tilletia controversa]
MSAVTVFPPPYLVPDTNEVEKKQPQQPQQEEEEKEGPKIMGALPAPSDVDVDGSARQTGDAATATPRLNLASDSDSSTVKFDALGPLVVNSDGTLSRIHNWSSMAKSERERTLRVLGKRNQSRIAGLRAKEEEGEKEGEQ